MTTLRPQLAPHQLRFLEDRSKIKIARWCRRAGKDRTSAAGKVIDRLSGRSQVDCNYITTKEDKAREYIKYCAEFCTMMSLVVEVVAGVELFGSQEIQTWRITFPEVKGKRPVIRALSSSPEDPRGYDGDIVISELPFIPDHVKLYDAAIGCTTLGGTMEILSTPKVEGDFFEQLCAMGERRAAGAPLPGDMDVSLHVADIHEIATNGYLDIINAARGTSLTPEQFVLDCRSMCRTQDIYDREFLLKASSEEGSYFPYELLRQVVSGGAPHATDNLSKFLADVRARTKDASEIRAGVDIGRRHDLFVIWVWAKVGGVKRTAGILALRNQNFGVMEMAIDATMKLRSERNVQVERMCIDETGMGMMIAERAKMNYGLRAEAIHFSLAVKQELATRARREIEEKTCDLPDDPVVLASFNGVKRTTTSTGAVRFDGERTDAGHVDHYIAGALGLHAFDEVDTRVFNVRSTGGFYN